MSDIIATTANNNGIERRTSVEGKHCWVCFATEEDDYLAQWVSPCKCRGTAKWVHKACLQRWIDEKQQGNSSIEVACPQCSSTYIIVYPRSDIIVKYLDLIDRLLNKISPVLAGGILLGSFYWTTVSYGALTIMLILDQKDALSLMENSDPLLLLIGLPLIPFAIVASRFIRWEDAILKYWRKYSTHLFGVSNSSTQFLPRRPNTNYNSPYGDGLSIIRIICGGLIMPVISTMVGKLFPSKLSNLKRFVLGSITYLGLKGVLKLYYKQRQYLRQAYRQIKSFEGTSNDASAAAASAIAAGSSNRSSLANRSNNNHNLNHHYHHSLNCHNHNQQQQSHAQSIRRTSGGGGAAAAASGSPPPSSTSSSPSSSSSYANSYDVATAAAIVSNLENLSD